LKYGSTMLVIRAVFN